MPNRPDNAYQIASDSRLAQLSQQGDLDAYEQLVRRHQHRLVCFLKFYSADRQLVEDVAQEAFLQCFLKIDQFDRRRSFRTWLYTIARRFLPRLAVSRPATIPLPDLPYSTDNKSGPLEQAIRTEHRMSLWQTVRDITNGEEFQLIWFRYADRLSMSEISGILGQSTAACKMRLSRLRKRLRPNLEKFVESSDFQPSPPITRTRAA